jgi:transcriptional regulator with XRE-family HTH domain
MKKYLSIGELLYDYRIENQLSQIDFSSQVNVDIRTIQRWEKDITLIKPEKEKEIVEATLLPYQLIRNLNAAQPIPTFYDFRIRKYSLAKLNNELPEADWLKPKDQGFSKRIRTIDVSNDMDMLKRDLKVQKFGEPPISKSVLSKAIDLLPELNLIIMDDYQNYSGHCIVLPISLEAFKKLNDKEIADADISLRDLVNYKTVKKPAFFNYDITADCNDNVFYLAHKYLKFFQEFPNNGYEFCSYTMRYDSYKLNEQLGLELQWEGTVKSDHLGLEYHPRFYSGNFDKFLSDNLPD